MAPGRQWVRGLDPPIYLLSLAPPLVGVAVAGAPDVAAKIPVAVAAAATVAFVVIHVAVNILNDAFDAGTAADRVKRHSLAHLAPVPVLAAAGSGLLVAGVAVGTALWLRVGGWHVPALGALGVALALLYHAPPWRLSSRGWGEAVTMLGFGIVPVAATGALGNGRVPPGAWLPGLAIGLAAASVLWHHNIASASTDGAAGKLTLAVRLGRRAWFGTAAIACAVGASTGALWWAGTRQAGAAAVFGVCGAAAVMAAAQWGSRRAESLACYAGVAGVVLSA